MLNLDGSVISSKFSLHDSQNCMFSKGSLGSLTLSIYFKKTLR